MQHQRHSKTYNVTQCPGRRAIRCFSSSGQAARNAQLRQQQQQISSVDPSTDACSPPQHTLATYMLSHASRRDTLAAAALFAGLSTACWGDALPATAVEGPDLTVTDLVYFDVGVASSAFKPAAERTLGDRTILPEDAQPAGRIVVGLYGRVAPVTVSNLVAAVKSGSFTGSAFSRISPGEYIQLGKQGSRRQGDVEPPPGVLQFNTDLASPGPFSLSHSRPGTIALSLSENDEDPATKDRPNYRALEFYITTGPGPVPRLDGVNPVFGRVESGMDTVIQLAQVPSFQPDIRSQQLNRFAKFLGDERADNVRRQYGKPLKAIIILGSGVVGESGGTLAPAGKTAAAGGSLQATAADGGGGGGGSSSSGSRNFGSLE